MLHAFCNSSRTSSSLLSVSSISVSCGAVSNASRGGKREGEGGGTGGNVCIREEGLTNIVCEQTHTHASPTHTHGPTHNTHNTHTHSKHTHTHTHSKH